MTKLTEEQLKEREQYFSEPINQVQVNENMTVRAMLDNFSNMSIQARNLGTAAKVWEAMVLDDAPQTIFLGLAGPLVAAGLRNIICDMIKNNMVDVVVSTGAIIYQDFFYARGNEHYRGTPQIDDSVIGKLRINRIYDVFSDDIAFEVTDDFISKFSETLKPGEYSSREFLIELAKTIDDENSILKTCVEMGKPIFIPAMNDSSIGIGIMKHWARHEPGERVVIDSIKDNYEIVKIILDSKSTSAVYIGGGVPKNFVNDAVVMANFDFDAGLDGHKYAVQLSTAMPMDGGLSGSTLSEAISWGKVSYTARKSNVYLEASVGLPLLYAYLNDNKEIGARKPPKFNF
ncbi:MAG: deoxyhypusine synthase family protein [Thermoplasmata archaeon]|nr:MAG: deoxyhypusine synthase family protein [Thermoplasmata archaeon]